MEKEHPEPVVPGIVPPGRGLFPPCVPLFPELVAGRPGIRVPELPEPAAKGLPLIVLFQVEKDSPLLRGHQDLHLRQPPSLLRREPGDFSVDRETRASEEQACGEENRCEKTRPEHDTILSAPPAGDAI